jgi:Na+/H+-dicarboxylate symporter
MIFAPLIFATLVGGIAHMRDATAIGRIGGNTLIWFLGASIVSLIVGLALDQLLHPGGGLGLHVGGEAPAAVDHLLDMGRSGTNVIGNSVAAVVVAKWEGECSTPAQVPLSRASATEY